MTAPTRRSLLAVPLAAPALAQAPWPQRSIALMVPYPPGGSTDNTARPVAQKLSEVLGQNVVIENRGGAGGTIGAAQVATAKPDGYTFLCFPTAVMTISPHMIRVPYDPQRDLEPIALLSLADGVMAMHPAVPLHDMAAVIAYARANPDKISHGSGGVGSISHICAEMFKAMSGIRMVHVPYRGSTIELGDLVAGRIEMAFDPLPSSLDYIRDGRLKALAVTTLARSETLPDVPTVASFLPGYEANVWVGLCAPRALPADLIQRLNTEINAVLADAAFRKRMLDLGASPLPLTPAAFGKLIADDTEKWTKVINAAGIKAE